MINKLKQTIFSLLQITRQWINNNNACNLHELNATITVIETSNSLENII